MKNKEGQALILFVVLIPLLITFLCCVIDFSYMLNNKNKLDNINKYVIKEGFKNINELEQVIYINDKDIIIKNIDINDNNITIYLEKNVKSLFGSIIGIKEYNLKSIYQGNRKTNIIKNKM